MPSTLFGPQVLLPIAGDATVHQTLKRRSSAPELPNFTAQSGGRQVYAVGEILRLQVTRLPNSIGLCTVVRAEIIRLFLPFTMAAVMVVRIHEPALDLEGDFVLKVYDRRTDCDARIKKGNPWSARKELEFERRRWDEDTIRYSNKLLAHDDLDYGLSELNELKKRDSASGEAEEGASNDMRKELWLETFFLKMHRAELELYKRARHHGDDGIVVPRFITSVTLPSSYTSKVCVVTDSSLMSTRGILMQYIPGFPLTDLYMSPSPRPLRSTWQSLVDGAVHTATKSAQVWNARNLDCCARNTVVHWDPIAEKWQVKFIDFGHCDYKQEGMSDWNWRGHQSCADEEGEIAWTLKVGLKKHKDFEYEYTRSDFWNQIDIDFNMDEC
ncbi:hypothetical protein NX059_002237 [Plenodomus lindquistii]|nr:hypothetical protein NX059_002237 [Plenodomus lindquistii]